MASREKEQTGEYRRELGSREQGLRCEWEKAGVSSDGGGRGRGWGAYVDVRGGEGTLQPQNIRDNIARQKTEEMEILAQGHMTFIPVLGNLDRRIS